MILLLNEKKVKKYLGVLFEHRIPSLDELSTLPNTALDIKLIGPSLNAPKQWKWEFYNQNFIVYIHWTFYKRFKTQHLQIKIARYKRG